MIGRDLRFAFRLMRQTPIVSSVALLSLALGIGANVAIFSLVNALLLKTLPVHQPEQLVLLTEPQPEFPDRPPASYWTNPQWEFLRDHSEFLDGILATGAPIFNLNTSGERRPAMGLLVSGRFFDVLGVTPHIGRLFANDDDRRGGGSAGPVAVVSYAFWQRELGGNAAALGRTLSLDGHAFTIIGVTPPGFLGIDVGRSFDVAVPLGTEPIISGAETRLDRRSSWWLRIAGRLKPGQTIAEAEAQLRGRQQALREATVPPDWRADFREYLGEPFTFTAAATGVSDLRLRYRRPLLVLLGIAGFVLLIACANMANLLLAQSVARQRELAVRLSLGASRWQLVQQLLVENLVLSTIGALAGLVTALWASRLLVGMLSTSNSVVTYDLSIDWRVLGFTTAVGVGTALLFGVAPAMRSTRVQPADALRNHARGVVAGRSRFNPGHMLVGLQIALSFVLVLGASLFVRTLLTLTTQDFGFQTSHVLIASVDLRRTLLAAAERPQFLDRLRERVATTPGVQAAALSVVTPISQNMWNTTVEVAGYDAPDGDRRNAYMNAVTPGYLSLMGTPILTGRDVAHTDRTGSPRVALVNEAFTRKYFKSANPLGQTFLRRTGPTSTMRLQVVGLVADAKYADLREAAQPTIYLPWLQEPSTGSTAMLSVRASGPADAFRSAVLAAIMDAEKEAVVTFRAFDADIRAATRQERMIASLSAVFGGLALLLAAIGLYGVMSYAVTRRRNEIGIRMALGAERGAIMRLVFGHVVIVTICGLVVGIAVAIGAGKFVNSLLYGLTTTDSTMIAIAAATLAIAAGLAGYLPARRAARVDPMVALREN